MIGFEIGNITITYYGLFIVIGLVIATIIGLIIVKREELDYNDFFIVVATGALFAIVGAKLLFLIVNIKMIDWTSIFCFEYFSSLMSGGFVFWGGLLGGLFSIVILEKMTNVAAVKIASCSVCCIPFFHGFARLGCGLVGCCYGKNYSGLFSVSYECSLFAPNNVKLFPVQYFEAVGEIIIGIVLLLYTLYRDKKNSIYLYLLLYSCMRFFLEYFRGDAERGIVYCFSVSQWICLFVFMCSFYILGKEKLKNG